MEHRTIMANGRNGSERETEREREREREREIWVTEDGI